MGRSSQQTAKENRVKIVETACRMFRESGVENVSVSEIMAVNGMTVGGFYKHFDSKDALVAEAFALAFDQSLESWEEVYEWADANAVARGPALVRQYLRNRAAKNRCPVLAFAPQVAASGINRACLEAYESGTKSLFEKFVSEMEGAGTESTKTSDDESQAMVLFAAMVGARLLAQAIGDAPWIKAMEAAVNEAANQ